MPQSDFWPFVRNKPGEPEDVDFSGQALLLVSLKNTLFLWIKIMYQKKSN